MSPDTIFGGGFVGALSLAAWMLFRAKGEIRKLRADGVKVEADASKVITDTALELLVPLRAAVEAATAEAARARKQAKEAQDRATDALRQVSRLRTELEAYHHHYGPLSAEQLAWRNR